MNAISNTDSEVNNNLEVNVDPFGGPPTSSSSGPTKRHTQSQGGVYEIQCCSGDFCNNGSFPVLPPVVSYSEWIFLFEKFNNLHFCIFFVLGNLSESTLSYSMKICLAIFGPVIILGSIAAVIILILRNRHKERLNKARKKQDVEYYTGDDLRITQPGDSTLRVSFKLQFNF